LSLRQQFMLHMRMGRGGYAFAYRIIDEAGKTVGQKCVSLARSDAKPVTVFTMGDDEFASAEEFMTAYQRKVETERRDQEWEAAAP
jgi:hypothetical protein